MAKAGLTRCSTASTLITTCRFATRRNAAANRADVAMLVRDGYLSVLPDATLRPREPMSRARVLHAFARLLEGRLLLQLQKGNARPTANGALILRSTKGKDLPIKVSEDAYLFRLLGELVYPVSYCGAGWWRAGYLSL